VERVAKPVGSTVEDLDARWRAANYLSVGQIYLLDNPLLRESLEAKHIKPRLLGHWGTTPGLTLLWTHLNRVIVERDLDVLFVTGPGHGGPAIFGSTWLDGSLEDRYPELARDANGMGELFQRFSFPYGLPSHTAAETPGSINEGGELGYSLAHAYGAAFDNPDLLVACVIGDGEAESGPLAAAWHSNRFLDPGRDGTVLPILHLNGWKIANPSVLARLDGDQLDQLLRGYGHRPYVVEGDDPAEVHEALAATLDEIVEEIADLRARRHRGQLPAWPALVLRTPKGWTGPTHADGKQVEGTWRSHQVPLARPREDPEALDALERWMRSYRPEDLFDEQGRPCPPLDTLVPVGDRRMGSNPHTDSGRVLRPLRLPDFRAFAVPVERPGATTAEATRVLGGWLRDIIDENDAARNFRLFGPDETASNRLGDVFDVTGRTWPGPRGPVDDDLRLEPDGRVMEILSEHTCQGWVEGYLLTGRHGLFSCYEAFIHIVDSMVNQHAKWLKVSAELDWRTRVASLNYLLTSHVWRQDHNGFSHQDPGFLNHLADKKPSIARVYLPPDANSLLAVMDRCLRSRHQINAVVAGKQPALQYLAMDDAIAHLDKGAGTWDWASTDTNAGPPDVVLACAGDVPTMETLAAADLLRRHLPDLRVRVVNVINLFALARPDQHPDGLDDPTYDALFTVDRPVIFDFHGYPWLVHRLAYKRHGHNNLHVRGFIDEGTTTTPFDMCVRNRIDRYHLVIDVIDRVLDLGASMGHLRDAMVDQLTVHREHVTRTGDDLPEVRDWQWPSP
jgi:xylulose-5-phosphate/fructose-6-phosphate phosphoketolase